jgi:hypothetical protein
VFSALIWIKADWDEMGQSHAMTMGHNDRHAGLSPLPVAEQFERYIAMMGALCGELEQIADNLPGPLDAHACLDLAQRTLTLIKRAHDFEETQVWPLVEQLSPDAKQTLNHLSFEHWGDEDFAEQVFHQLRGYVQQPGNADAESLSWTLRGFFQNMQRHLAFECQFLLPLISGH